MKYTGNLLKMTTCDGAEIQYSLKLNGDKIEMNPIIGNRLLIQYGGEINCTCCGKKIKKSYGQGFCFPCFQTSPENEECVLRPELCRAHEGIARDMEYAKSHCLIDHYVYLAISSGLKVGVTRNTQIPTRWLDQGAIKAIPIAKTPNRYTAGLIEVALKEMFADKTNWRSMLTNQIDHSADLLEMKGKAEEALSFDLRSFILNDDEVYAFRYPVLEYPTKVKSISLDKMPEIDTVLKGIKGQYLIFENGLVFNIRNHSGYKIELTID